MTKTTKLTATQIETLGLALKVIGLLGSREEARARYQQLVALVGDEEAGRVLAAAR